jgi:hypothetical protein
VPRALCFWGIGQVTAIIATLAAAAAIYWTTVPWLYPLAIVIGFIITNITERKKDLSMKVGEAEALRVQPCAQAMSGNGGGHGELTLHSRSAAAGRRRRCRVPGLRHDGRRHPHRRLVSGCRGSCARPAATQARAALQPTKDATAQRAQPLLRPFPAFQDRCARGGAGAGAHRVQGR